MKLNDGNYIMEVSGEIAKLVLDNGSIMYNGPLEAQIKGLHKGYGLIGLNVNANGEGSVSVTVGDISDDGTAIVFFGKPNAATTEGIKKLAEKARVKESYQRAKEREQKPESSTTQLTTFSAMSTTSVQDYRYKTGNMSTYLKPPTSQYYYPTTGQFTVLVNGYGRDPDLNGNGTGSALMKAYTNNNNVKQYLVAEQPNGTYFDAWCYKITTSFHSDQNVGYIHVQSSGPTDSQPIQSFSVGVWFPSIGNYMDMLLNAAFALYNSSEEVTSTKTIDYATNRVVNVSKSVKYVGWDADATGQGWATNQDLIYDDGGLATFFDYLEWTSGYKTLVSSTTIMYYGTNGLYSGYYYSPTSTITWAANFLT